MIRLVAVLLGGMFLDGYILGLIGPVSGTFAEELGISSLWEGLIASAALVGILVGAPLGGWAADKFGRKPLFLADIMLFLLASSVQFFVDGPAQLFWVRLAMGIAIGAEYSVGWPLMSEFAPRHLRGRLMGLTLVAWYTGFMVAYFIGFQLNAAGVSWRLILGSSTLLAAVLLVARFGLPESPRWLWNVGRQDEARAVAHRYMANAADMEDVEHEDTEKGSFGMLFSREHWRATVFMSVFWFCAVAPYFAIATFADSVLQQYGLAGGLAGGRAVRGRAGRGRADGRVDRQDRAPRADGAAAVVVHRGPGDHRAVGGRPGDRRPGPVPGLLVLQRDVQHVDRHLPR
jgi:putative MFS transporter